MISVEMAKTQPGTSSNRPAGHADRGKQFGGLHAASGKIGAGAGNSLRLAALGIVFRSAGLPVGYPAARFVIWLKQNNFFDEVRAYVEAKGRKLEDELWDLYASPVLAEAVLAAYPNFAPSPDQVLTLIEKQFPERQDITDDEMLAVIRDVLVGSDGKLPCTLLAFDEIQQYIGSEGERSRQVYEIAEAMAKRARKSSSPGSGKVESSPAPGSTTSTSPWAKRRRRGTMPRRSNSRQGAKTQRNKC